MHCIICEFGLAERDIPRISHSRANLPLVSILVVRNAHGLSQKTAASELIQNTMLCICCLVTVLILGILVSKHGQGQKATGSSPGSIPTSKYEPQWHRKHEYAADIDKEDILR